MCCLSTAVFTNRLSHSSHFAAESPCNDWCCLHACLVRNLRSHSEHWYSTRLSTKATLYLKTPWIQNIVPVYVLLKIRILSTMCGLEILIQEEHILRKNPLWQKLTFTNEELPWCVNMWVFKEALVKKCFSHNLHCTEFPVCWRMCSFNWYVFLYALPQTVQR